MTTRAIFFPFDLFGSAGAKAGAELLADAFQEMLADNKRERSATRARAYASKVRSRSSPSQRWPTIRTGAVRPAHACARFSARTIFLLWVSGNHLGALPIYDEVPRDTLVIQLDAHLDIYHLSDCTAELSHGNFLLHAEKPFAGNRQSRPSRIAAAAGVYREILTGRPFPPRS